MQLTYQEAVMLPTYYEVSYRRAGEKRDSAYFDNKLEAEAYALTLPPEYKICPPCNGKCDTCGVCMH